LTQALYQGQGHVGRRESGAGAWDRGSELYGRNRRSEVIAVYRRTRGGLARVWSESDGGVGEREGF
jgi:hypothetical protein